MYFNNDIHIPLNTDKEKEFDLDGPIEIYECTEFDVAVKMDMAELSSLFMGGVSLLLSKQQLFVAVYYLCLIFFMIKVLI